MAAMSTSAQTAPIRYLDLGIGDISSCGAGRMEFGHVYALNTSCPTIRFPLLGSLIGNAVDAGVACSLVLRSRVEEYLEQLNTPPKIDLPQAFTNRSLNVYLMQDDFQKKLFQSGPRRMLDEIVKFGLVENSLLVLEHAPDLLNLHDMSQARSQLDAIADWSRDQNVATLIVFANTEDRRVISPRALLDSMSGLAEFEDDREGLALSFPYWRSCGQVATGERFVLQLSPDGCYSTVDSVVPFAPHEPAPELQHPLKTFIKPSSPAVAATEQPREVPPVSMTNSSLRTGVRDFDSRRELMNSRLVRPHAIARASRRKPS